MDFVTIDFEASCLPRHGASFPIELGVSGPQGTRSWLIRPHDDWRDWDWTQEALDLHGITRARLEAEGQAPDAVLAQALEAIGTARVFADSRLDAQWWATLSAAAPGVIAAPLVQIEHVDRMFDEIGATHQQIMDAQHHADLLCPQRHRAGADARWLRLLLDRLLEGRVEQVPVWVEAEFVAGPAVASGGLFV